MLPLVPENAAPPVTAPPPVKPDVAPPPVKPDAAPLPTVLPAVRPSPGSRSASPADGAGRAGPATVEGTTATARDRVAAHPYPNRNRGYQRSPHRRPRHTQEVFHALSRGSAGLAIGGAAPIATFVSHAPDGLRTLYI